MTLVHIPLKLLNDFDGGTDPVELDRNYTCHNIVLDNSISYGVSYLQRVFFIETVRMSHDASLLQKPFSVIYAIRLLWLSLILGVVCTFIYWKPLVSTMPHRTDVLTNEGWLFASNLFLLSITIWLISKIAAGYNWSRNIFFLGFVLMVPLRTPILIEMYHYTKIYSFISATILFFQFIALCLLFSDSGNDWFKEIKAFRKKIAQ